MNPKQLVLDLAHRQALGLEDFLVSASNAAAVDMIDQWPNWAKWAVVLSGAPGAGKSHLVNVWRQRSGACAILAPELGPSAIDELKLRQALAIENIDLGLNDEKLVFHLLNLAREHAYSILITSRAAPGDLAVTLPDLRSRLRALPHIEIGPPDDALLGAILVKQFDDRQLKVDPTVIGYLVRHMERSSKAAADIVARLDRMALEKHAKVSRALAVQALAGEPG